MYKGKRVAVTIPAYNEEAFVGEVIDTVPDYVDRIYVVDDHSTDGTWEVIQKHAQKRNDRVRPEADDGLRASGGQVEDVVLSIHHEENRGVGSAIKTGYMQALEEEMDAVAVMAGDGQMDPEILDRILDPIVEERAEYSKGNRLRQRDYREDMSSFRFFGNSLLTFLTKISSGYWKMMDPQNGYTAISKDALEKINIKHIYDDYGFANELLVHLNTNDMRVADVPMPAVYRDEQSWISYKSFIPRTSKLLLFGFLWRLKAKYILRNFHPLVFFYILGFISTLLGVLGAGYTFYAGFVQGLPMFPRGTLSLILFMMGNMFILFAMLFDMQTNEELEIKTHV